MMFLFLLACFVPGAFAQLRLFHRVHHPSIDPPLPFLQKGLIHSDSATVEHVQTYADAFSEFASIVQDVPDALYQIAMERDGDKDETQWDLSSVKACHLSEASSETFILRLSPYDNKPYTLEYFISPIPHDASCPTPKRRSPKSASSSVTSFKPFQNTTVFIRSPSLPPSPELRSPPPLTPQGDPVKAEPEKSFVQKYWVYLVAVALALLLAPGGGTEDSQGGGEAPRR